MALFWITFTIYIGFNLMWFYFTYPVLTDYQLSVNGFLAICLIVLYLVSKWLCKNNDTHYKAQHGNNVSHTDEQSMFYDDAQRSLYESKREKLAYSAQCKTNARNESRDNKYVDVFVDISRTKRQGNYYWRLIKWIQSNNYDYSYFEHLVMPRQSKIGVRFIFYRLKNNVQYREHFMSMTLLEIETIISQNCKSKHNVQNDTQTDRKRKVSNKQRQRILRRDNFTCQLCGARGPGAGGTAELNVDHKKPWSLGGTDDDDNLWTLCWECNSGKSNLYDDSEDTTNQIDDNDDYNCQQEMQKQQVEEDRDFRKPILEKPAHMVVIPKVTSEVPINISNYVQHESQQDSFNKPVLNKPVHKHL